MANPEYRKFARARGYDPQGIYVTDDHLLVINGAFGEKYRRMFFRDIEAFSVASSFQFTGIILLFIPAIALFAWLSWATRNEFGGGLPFFFLIPTTLLIALLIYHIVRGPTVRCSLRTGVQTLRLTALQRRRKAEAFLDLLIEKTGQSQSPFDLDTFTRFVRLQKNTPPPIPLPERPPEPPPLRPGNP